jgi:hypothetical protein
VLGAGCSSGLGNRKRSGADDDDQDVKSMGGGLRLRNPELAEKYKAAKAAPESFEPVFAYARAIADLCLASLVETNCDSCTGGRVKYKRLSELDPHNWPFIEDAQRRVEALMNVPALDLAQMEQLVAVKGRLLWLVGRSAEEQTLIDGYALAHPDAVVVVRRRLELLREDSDVTKSESQCTRSRAKMKSAPAAAAVDLLTGCVELHPDNTDGRADMLDYAKYLPNLTPEEDHLYRTHLAQRCLVMVGDEETRCAQACACTDQPAGKPPIAKCKRACRDCHSETASKVRVCKKLGEDPPASRPKAAPARAHRPKAAPAAPAPRPKGAPARRPKGVDPDLEPQKTVL